MNDHTNDDQLTTKAIEAFEGLVVGIDLASGPDETVVFKPEAPVPAELIESPNIGVFDGFTGDQFKAFASAIFKEADNMLADISSLDLVNELRRRGVIKAVNGTERVNEIDYQSFGNDKHWLARRFRYAASEIGEYLANKTGKPFTTRQIVATAPNGWSLTPEEVDTGHPVHMRRFEARAWMVDLSQIGEGGT